MKTRHRNTRAFRLLWSALLALTALGVDAAAAPGDGGARVGPRPAAGWPVILGNPVAGRPAVADIDGDGRDEIAVNARDSRTFLIDGRGRILPGWPQAAANGLYRAPLLEDIDGDGRYEVASWSIDGFLHVWEADGSVRPGWPLDLGAYPRSAPILHAGRGGSGRGVLLAVDDGTVHLFDPDGGERPGWPIHTGESSASLSYTAPRLVSADIDADSEPEILYIAWDAARLHAWKTTGEAVPGFPRTLGENGIAITVEPGSGRKRIACSTLGEVIVLDAGGEVLLRLPIPGDDDQFESGAAFVPAANNAPGTSGFFAAGTRKGTVYLWDEAGNVCPGWPVQLGGFIYGIPEQSESFAVHDVPTTWDVDGDGELELLICSQDQHLYCFELDGSCVPGWPLTLEDALLTSPVPAQLDGTGPEELVIGQYGEAVFAFHIDSPGTGRNPPPAGRSSLEVAGEWPGAYFVVAACIVLLLLLLYPRLRFWKGGAARAAGVSVWVVFILVVTLVAVRAALLAVEVVRYREEKKRLGLAAPVVERVVAAEQRRVQELAADIAGKLESPGAMEGGTAIKLLYQMEKFADERRLDYRYTGLMVTDPTGKVVQAVGLARGWKHLDDLGLSTAGPAGPVIMEDNPVLVGRVRVGSGRDAGYCFLFSSMLVTLPQSVANAAGVSARLQLNGRSLAWGGTTAPPSLQNWPWLGVVEPAHAVVVSRTPDGSELSFRLAQEESMSAASGWLDLGIVVLVPVLFYLVSLRRRLRLGAPLKWWWPPALVVLYAVGLGVFSRGQWTQRPVPVAGHGLEFLLQLAGLLGIAVVFGSLVGERRSRRVSFALLGSYLVVGILPLAVALVLTTGLLQRAQRRATEETLADLERRADNLTVAYMGTTKFIAELNRVAETFFDQPPETAWFDFVSQNQYLFTYDLPAAYLTLWVEDRDDPERYFTGYSWRAPRTEKFFSRRPAWTGDRNQKGLFVDRGDIIVRAIRTLRTNAVEAQIVGNIPLDQPAVRELEERLRILPFLPRVRLLPAWQVSAGSDDEEPGWHLPLSTELVVPARDWASGEARWLVYRAYAHLPVGREMWTVLLSLVLLALLPLVLSAWGAYYTFRRTVRPMDQLLAGIQRVETGDLDYRLSVRGQSEIAITGAAFDRMADSLKEKVRELAEKKKVEELSKLKSEFISMVSHDLKTPLSSIKGASENVLAGLAGPVTEKQRKYLEIILNGTGILQKMITDLLDLSRIESGHLRLELETMDLKREAEDVLRSVQPLLDEQSLNAEVAAITGDTLVRADRSRLWQVFHNVIANAVRYSPRGGTILIAIDDAGPASDPRAYFVRTTIADEGPGIPEEEIPKMFEPFYARPAGPAGGHGAGLGLAIVKQLIELHGGTVALRNRDRGGAAFSFTLPRKETSAQ